MDGAASGLPFEQFLRHKPQPLAVDGSVLDPHQPRQAQQHPRPFLLDAIGPVPLVRIPLHHGPDPLPGPAKKWLIASLVVEPQVRGPDPGLVMGGEMGIPVGPVVGPSCGKKFPVIDARLPEA